MLLIAIVLGTLAAGIGSVFLAALLRFGVLARYTQHMLSLAAGALLATAFMHLLPEAFEGQASAHQLFMTLLLGLVFFFLLDKAELWHHGHEHHHGPTDDSDPGPRAASYPPPLQPESHAQSHTHSHAHAHEQAHSHEAQVPAHGDGHSHPHGHEAHAHRPGSWAVLAGDSVHCFGDGILIASAFVADLSLGVIAALAVLAHEVPHHMGDLVVLGQNSVSRRVALMKVTLAGAVTALGGVVGYWLVDLLHEHLIYFLVVAASSFIYVALADLIPQLQKRLSLRATLAQIAWLAVGMGAVALVSVLTHKH